MRRLALFSVIPLFIFSPQAKAGFEWLPPTRNPAPTIAPQIPQEALPSSNVAGTPPAPVISEPLGVGAPMPISPPVQPVKNLSGQGLYIDPYPMRNAYQSGEISTESVGQAMAEKANILNPIQLGAGMTTGAKPTLAAVPNMQGQGVGVGIPRAPVGGSLTPMTGGEPPPLPGMGGYKSTGPRQAVPIVNYDEAVGFGRDLPLALALSQIIPSEFSHSYVDGVDAGTSVSWEGGRPWNQVLEDMLRSKGLTASIQNNRVIIRPLASL